MAGEETVVIDADEQESYEHQARADGWQPQDKWKRTDVQWVDAKTFVERGNNFKADLIKTVKELREKVAGFEGTKAQFVKYHEEQIKAKDTELAAAISELKIQRNRATREGEDAEAVALEERIDSLKSQKEALKTETAQAKQQTETGVSAEATQIMNEWIADGNEWFKTNSRLRAASLAIAEDLTKSGEKAKGRDFLDKVRGLMEADFPEKFGKETRPNSVESGGNRTGKGSGKTEKDLPEEDRKLMEQFDREGWVKKSDFLKNYFERNA